MAEDYKPINGTLCFLKNKSKILFLYRGRKDDMHGGFYIPPGGHTESGERGIDCIIREFRQETGLKLLDPKLRVIATFYNKDRILGGREDPEDWKVEVYDATRFEGKLKAEYKECPLLWVEESRMGEMNMYPGDRRIYEVMKNEGIYEVRTKYSGKKLTGFKCARVG
jgi:8-oxo-dGTP diphosphatase